MTQNIDDLKQQIELVCIERGLDPEEVLNAIESAIASAYRREFGQKEMAYEAEFNAEKGTYTIYQTTAIVDEVKNIGREISVVEARLSNPSAQNGDVIRQKIEIDHEVNFGRIASQVAKQVLTQAINSARHTKVLQQFRDKVGDLVTIEVDSFKKGGYTIKLSQTMGYIPKEHLLPIDRFRPGQLIKALILDISEDDRGNLRIQLSRTTPDFVKAIIKSEVPEVSSGIVTIDKIAREPGSRSKILVSVNEDEREIDPVGTILGRKNVRLVNIMREISSTMQEKVDIIENRQYDLESMIMDSLEPAEIERVEINQAERVATVHCYPEEASLAVGKRGVNIRLAGELLNYQLNLQTIEEDNSSPSIVTG